MLTEMTICNVGLIGLGVMGRNLVLNLADHGYRAAVYNRTGSVTQQFLAEHGDDPFPDDGGLIGCETLEEFVSAIKPPRVIVVLVKAGPAVDAVCEQLIDAGIRPHDIIVDGGNSLWTDTIRRERDYRGRLTFFGSGISGGEVGARFGPSLMPGGDQQAWQRLKPIWESIAAKVDPRTGQPLEGGEPGKPVTGGEPCTAYLGPDGAGHYVKMVHNGIEYADMQLIAEAYSLLRISTALSPAELAEVFAEWNRCELESYLIEITADILKQDDPVTGKPLVDVILDRAGMKGTGTWTAVNALELGVPAMSIAEAVFARSMSGLKDERTAASRVLAGPHSQPPQSKDAFIEAVRDALYCSKICAYAQGFGLMRAAQDEYDWQLDFGEIARIWRGGCIIRAAFLQKITEAYGREPSLANLLLDGYFSEAIAKRQAAWREVVSQGALRGIPTPAFSSALAYYDSYRSETLPANLLQAQRDYFGAHTYERMDQPAGKHFHLDWTDPKRPQVKA
ncbi:MAG: NADP-dependent phosphogluconate dehydrogenase [Planctomycetes bacterium]|nr:NADP-dependent phosphogluconate dehydrogenase [Planctomycetota bacterium]